MSKRRRGEGQHRRKTAPTFGISLEPTWRIYDSLKLAMLAERLGFSTVWVPDGGPAPPYSDTIVTLSAIASHTTKIRLGSAVLNFYTRNPAFIASSFLALSDLASSSSSASASVSSASGASRKSANSSQRAILGIGIGSTYNVSKIGIGKRSGTVTDLREAIESIRELFNDKEVTVRTDSFAIENVLLSKSMRGKIPIHVGAGGPRALRLAGEIADGIILTDRVASDIETSMKPVTMGLTESSRSRKELEVTNSIVISVDENPERAKDLARPTCAYLVSWVDDERASDLGFDLERKQRISKYLSAGDESSAARLVDDKMVSTLTVSGKPSECIEKCREHLAHSIDHLAFCEPFGRNAANGISLIARKVIPGL